ncbi:hypothetical protein B4U45_02170 [Mycobacterium persicum]|uniref:Uncharacterized protein n=1 Tax=Mycobacterium persicum TaxID=1487726 RepID=A0A8E2IMD8_9MYCO|nr:hypothetical protein B1T49_06015 [Mycobacterium persicum]ORB93570.1 hypothetical protein B1T44_02190 [Mycobacterium persicum]ORC05647.1 hypothetical protein B4U45_02170 [Mycobacterium persicum]
MAPANGDAALGVCPWAACEVDFATGDIIEAPADGDEDGEGATAAPETGPTGAAVGGVMTGGRRSEP